MVLVPTGEFVMGSDKKTDRLAYRSEIPQRLVYLDAFEIGKYEVTALEYLKFVLATDRPPQLDWRYDGGNFQEAMAYHPDGVAFSSVGMLGYPQGIRDCRRKVATQEVRTEALIRCGWPEDFVCHEGSGM